MLPSWVDLFSSFVARSAPNDPPEQMLKWMASIHPCNTGESDFRKILDANDHSIITLLREVKYVETHDIAEEIKHAKVYDIVIEDRVIGRCIYDKARLLWFMILPQYRRKGFGRRFFAVDDVNNTDLECKALNFCDRYGKGPWINFMSSMPPRKHSPFTEPWSIILSSNLAKGTWS